MTNIILFQFESNEIRFVDGLPVANDVATALGYADPAATISKKVSEQNRSVAVLATVNGDREVAVLKESGIYQLIFGSKLKSAEKFQDWVFSEVLPSIRKTGNYSIAPEPIPQLPSRVLAVETAVAIDRIQDVLSKSNPRLAQILIDCAMNDVIDLTRSLPAANEFPEDKWYGLVQIATKMGIKTNASTRVKLGQYIGKRVKELNLERVQEERLCNGQYESIWCYRDTDVIRDAINDWHEQLTRSVDH